MRVPVRRPRLLRIGLGVFLVGLALGTFWPATANGFVEFDDLSYVNDNPHVLSGLNANSIRWALTTTEMGNWHPLTWLSLMFDAQCWGTNPFGFHLTNLLLHLANVVLLYLALLWLTWAPVRSALVAALFAVHPLNVEAVAWVAERKGLLAAFFGLLTVAAYARYAERRRWIVYLAVVLFFALSLMAKAVTVTLPLVLLLLDFWPLRRPLASWRRLLLEKVPLLLLSLGFSIVAPLAQSDAGALRSVEQRPLMSRVANTLVNPVSYLRKVIWPSDLAVFYPYEQRSLFSPEVLVSAAILLAITVLALWLWRRRSYFAVGWFWYLGLLLPVVGLVPVGGHSLADRYVYLPIIGVFIIVIWGAAELLPAVRLRTLALPLSAAVIVACAFGTREQLPHWTDPVALWEQCLAVTHDNHRAYHNLGAHYLNMGRYAEGADNLWKAVRLRPEKADWHIHLGTALLAQGQVEEARQQFAEAARLDPTSALAANDLGVTLQRLGDLHGAAEQYHRAAELDPAVPLYRLNEEAVRRRLAQQSAGTAP